MAPRLQASLSRIVAVWALWSSTVLLLATLATHLPVAESPHWQREPLKSYRPVPLARWDAGWYYLIATEGYSYDPDAPHNTVGFYPLYPLLLRGAAAALPGASIFWLGIAISLLALLPALLLAGRLAEMWGVEDSALWTVGALLFFPTAYYFASVYTESIFLLVTAAAIWGARTDRWLLAGVAGAAAGLTRFNGALILLPLLWIAFTSSGRSLRLSPPKWAAIGTTLAGIAAFPIYLWSRFGDPLLYLRDKTAPVWSRRPTAPWTAVWDIVGEVWRRLVNPAGGHRLILVSGFLCVVVFLALSVLLVRRGLVGEGLYCGVSILLILSGGTIEAIQRYVLVLFPCFFLLGEMLRRRPALALAYAFGGVGLGMIFLHRFLHLIYVA